MESTLTAIEVAGIIDQHNQLHINTPLPITGPKHVRVILLYPTVDEFDENEWAQAAARNPAFDFLADPEEDIYTLADGKPFDDQA